jgi:hypothetical protein
MGSKNFLHLINLVAFLLFNFLWRIYTFHIPRKSQILVSMSPALYVLIHFKPNVDKNLKDGNSRDQQIAVSGPAWILLEKDKAPLLYFFLFFFLNDTWCDFC